MLCCAVVLHCTVLCCTALCVFTLLWISRACMLCIAALCCAVLCHAFLLQLVLCRVADVLPLWVTLSPDVLCMRGLRCRRLNIVSSCAAARIRHRASPLMQDGAGRSGPDRPDGQEGEGTSRGVLGSPYPPTKNLKNRTAGARDFHFF